MINMYVVSDVKNIMYVLSTPAPSSCELEAGPLQSHSHLRNGVEE